MMAPIPGLSVADTCELHTLAPRSGPGHRVFGVGASSPGVWKQHRGVVLALLEALEELFEELLEGRLSHHTPPLIVHSLIE